MPLYYCYFEHQDRPDYKHRMFVQAETQDKAEAQARYQFKRNFQLDVNKYFLESWEIKGSHFIID